MLIIEILTGHELPESRHVGQGEKRREIHFQRAYAHFGGAFPVEFNLPLEKPTDMYRIGKYQLSPQSFKVGQYGDLEINRFDIRLDIIASDQLKKVG
jgi:hypothetical protein